jgi:hypothetical protein
MDLKKLACIVAHLSLYLFNYCVLAETTAGLMVRVTIHVKVEEI